MPKSTFFNLPKDKIDKIVEVAIDEFAEYSYEKGSINRIVDGADIAKGSFYQYFEDKKDLYNFIVQEAEKKRLTYLTSTIDDKPFSNYFRTLKELYLAEIKFAKESFKLSKIILDFTKNDKGDKLSTYSVFEKLLIKGVENRDINDENNIKLSSYLLASINTSVLEYFIHEADLDIEKATKYIDNIVELLENGMKVKKRITRNIEDRFY